MSSNAPTSTDTFLSEHRTRYWDWLVTSVIVIVLCIPLPFVRFESWPQGTVLFEKLVTPWSQFRICYTSFPEEESVEEVYGFTWKGKVISRSIQPSIPLVFTSTDEPLLKWQKNPEVPLGDVFLRGDFVHVETFWQPLLFSPFRMIWHMRLDQREVSPGRTQTVENDH